MKISCLAYIPLHYGSPYLDAVIRSIDPHVEKILILYTEEPSYGQNRGLKNPDTRKQLYDIAHSASDKIQWVQIQRTGQENHHRQMVFNYAKDYDLIIAVDSDEIFDDVPAMKEAAMATNCQTVNVDGSRWWHFWRSFNECNRDGFCPTRFHVVKGNPSTEVIHVGKIYHMGYAMPEDLTRYKISVHGHKSILSTWLTNKWLNYKRGVTKLLHPDSQDVWIETEPFDKTTLPQILKEHPYYNLEKI